MRVPLSWLQSLTPLEVEATDSAAVAELASEMDSLGLVVESLDRVGMGLHGVILSEVKEIGAIAGADRIRRVVVGTGDRDDVEIVCGAWNFSVGDVVPLAVVGAELPGGLRIARRKMKGVVSNGMLCSGKELALSDDAAGILVLGRAGDPGIELGRPLGEHLGIAADVVFDLAVEPNRPDCLSMLGIARDLAARRSLPLLTPDPEVPESLPAAGELASVRVETPELCGRLTGRVMTGLSIVPSPGIVQRRLTLAGMRPIDCLVDASNYVMIELGQPSHPYDLSALGGRGLVARAARPGEVVAGLDGTEYVLGTRPARKGEPATALDCLICDANGQPAGIAGIIGGSASEITSATSSVLLEVAEFLPVAVGRSARHLGLRTEASVRFERGIDPDGVERASLRVCELVIEATKAAGVRAPVVAKGLLDDHPVHPDARHVVVRPARVNALLGTELEPSQITGLLEPIGYSSAATSASDRGVGESAGAPGEAGQAAKVLDLVIPSFRPDVVCEVDVIEDVARTFGYRNISRRQRRSPYVGALSEINHLGRRIRRVWAGAGAHEAWTSSIVDGSDQALAGYRGPLVRLSNPMASEESALRPALLGGLLGALSHNAGHRNPYIRLFEIGAVFLPRFSGSGSNQNLSEQGQLPPSEGPSSTSVGAEDSSWPVIETEHAALLLGREGDCAETAVHAWRVLADALGIENVELVNLRAADPAVSGEARPEVGPAALAGLHLSRTALVVAAGDKKAGRRADDTAAAPCAPAQGLLADGVVIG
ncbi:MAG: phenylalanine--tRNA ligase subunit beta, partial [Acidimicrobiales bacterium]